jgi:hypothetical protein
MTIIVDTERNCSSSFSIGSTTCSSVGSRCDTYRHLLCWNRRSWFQSTATTNWTPLIKQYRIASILIENPYYGLRKPPHQSRSSLSYVTDLYLMGKALILDTLVLLHWCQKMKLTPAILHGYSLGGHMASLAFTK